MKLSCVLLVVLGLCSWAESARLVKRGALGEAGKDTDHRIEDLSRRLAEDGEVETKRIAALEDRVKAAEAVSQGLETRVAALEKKEGKDFEELADSLKQAIENGKKKGEELGEKLKEAEEEAKKKISELVEKVKAVGEKGQDLEKQAKDGHEDGMEKLKELNQKLKSLQEAGEKIAHDLSHRMDEFFESIKQGKAPGFMEQLIEAAKKGVEKGKELGGKVIEGAKNVGNKGKDLLEKGLGKLFRSTN